MDAIQQAFVVESRELLQMMEDNLLQMESSGGDAETINAIFRAAHTIKGGAGVIECKFIVEFTHVLENVLDEMRSGTITPNRELIEVLLACSDQLDALVGCVESESEPGEDVNKASLSLREKLQHFLGKPAATDQRCRRERAESANQRRRRNGDRQLAPLVALRSRRFAQGHGSRILPALPDGTGQDRQSGHHTRRHAGC